MFLGVSGIETVPAEISRHQMSAQDALKQVAYSIGPGEISTLDISNSISTLTKAY